MTKALSQKASNIEDGVEVNGVHGGKSGQY